MVASKNELDGVRGIDILKRVAITDHSLRRYQERVGLFAGPRKLRRRLDQAVLSDPEDPWIAHALNSPTTLIFEDEELAYVVEKDNHGRGGHALVTIIPRPEVSSEEA